MTALGFVFGIVVGVLYFENFSCKNTKTREDAELLLTHMPLPTGAIQIAQPKEPYSWQ